MRTRMMLIATMVLIGAAAAGAQSKDGATVTGTWNLTVTGPAAHGDMPATMQLQQDGKNVTGTLSVHGTEHRLKGEFADSSLTLETTDTPADKSLSFSAKLKDDGTLAGYLSGPMGDMKWTGKKG